MDGQLGVGASTRYDHLADFTTLIAPGSDGDRVTRAVAPGEKIHVATGKFYSHRGHLIEITSHFCRVGSTHTLFGDVFEARGGTAVLG